MYWIGIINCYVDFGKTSVVGRRVLTTTAMQRKRRGCSRQKMVGGNFKYSTIMLWETSWGYKGACSKDQWSKFPKASNTASRNRVCNMQKYNKRYIGRDRFESTASAGRRIPSASSHRFASTYSRRPSTVFRDGRWKTIEVCIEPTFQNGSQNKRNRDMHRHMS